MANKYNAFISYRHAPEDIKIASEVQKSLERFKIPPAIQQKTGIKRFERVFRDKEELPITADLNDDIDEAIKNSDNLIVICSTRTNESIWVRKEIETFLKYHTKKEIFTVLVDGEPEDVIPDILQRDTITIKKADGTTETKEALIEPLSCDYRIGIKKARKVELPRLAASLLKCSYDELVQRRRQYERRRNAMIGTVSVCAGLCIMAYLTWSLMQIRMNYDLAQQNYQLAQDNYMLAQANFETAQANYQEALRNQSEYLATVSGEYLASDDRVSAVLLALAALPSEGNERPVTARAEYALARSLGLYMAPGAYDMEPVWRYSTKYEIREFFATFDNSKIIAVDRSGDITIWNTEDHSVYKVLQSGEESAYDMLLGPDDDLYIAYTDRLVAYDNSYDEPVWSIPYGETLSGMYKNGSLSLAYNADVLVCTYSNRMMAVDCKTGAILNDLDVGDEIPVLEEDTLYAWNTTRNLEDAYISPDGRYIATVSQDSTANKDIYVYDRERSEWIMVDTPAYSVRKIKYTDDDRLIVFYDGGDNSAASFTIGDMQYLARKVTTTALFDLNDGRKIWATDIPHTLDCEQVLVNFCNYDRSGETIPGLAVVIANKCAVLDMKNGNILVENELTGEGIYSVMSVGDDSMFIVLDTGHYLFTPMRDDAYVADFDYFLPNAKAVDVYFSSDDSDIFLIKYIDDNGVIEYKRDYYDKNYVSVELYDPEENISEALNCGDKALLFGSNLNLYCYDFSSDKLDWSVAIEGDTYYTDLEFVCAGPDNCAYMMVSGTYQDYTGYGCHLLKVDLSSGKISLVEGVPTEKTLYISHAKDVIVVVCYSVEEEEKGIYVYDMNTCTARKLELTGDAPDSFISGTQQVSPDGKRLVYHPYTSSDDKVYLIDLESGASIMMGYDCEPFMAWAPSSDKYALGTGVSVDVFDTSNNMLLSIPFADSEIKGLYLADDYILTVSTFGNLSKYDYEGALIGSVTLPEYQSMLSPNISFDFYDNELFLSVGLISYIVDIDEFDQRIFIPGLYMYDPETQKMFVTNFQSKTEMSRFGYYTRLTVEEMIEKGNEFAGDSVLGQEISSMYGI